MSVPIKATLAAALIGVAVQSPATAAANIASQMPARILAAHNSVRAQAGVAPLAWDPALGDAAARFAMELALTNSFHHSDRRARPGTGENLWMGTHGASSYEAMVGGWSSERRYFVPGFFPAVSRSGNWEDVGHYTQMVWPATTRVGCAVASNGRADFLVCRYSPAGNIDGRAVPYAASGVVTERAR
ncbi:MAG TPA: CAP domain-containing protein [Sphingomicrobium sp.]